MKKTIVAIMAAAMALSLTGCGETMKDIEVRGNSELFVHEDMTFAKDTVTETLSHWDEIPDDIEYLGDELCGDETMIENINEFCADDGVIYTECMGFNVDFHASKRIGVVIRKVLTREGNINREVKDYQFWFARTEGGEWQKVYQNDIDIFTYMKDETFR